MADQQNLVDIGHWWGSDLQLSPTGDLASVIQDVRSRQRVLRRLMTPTGSYLTHTEYGAGLPSKVGQNVDIPSITGLMRGEMFLEASVQQTPEPQISITPILNGINASLSYTVAPGADPAVLSFTVTQ